MLHFAEVENDDDDDEIVTLVPDDEEEEDKEEEEEETGEENEEELTLDHMSAFYNELNDADNNIGHPGHPCNHN